MREKKYWIWVIVSFSILIVLWQEQRITGETGLYAKDKETDSNLTPVEKSALYYKLMGADKKEILQGLEGVWVMVGDIEPELKKYGLTTKDLQTDTELQLRQYGIKVLTEKECLSTPGFPILCINVNVLIVEGEPIAAGAITVELREDVLLLRKPTKFCVDARTWQRSSVLSTGLHRIKDIRGRVKDLVNEFINDYLAANSKEKATDTKKKRM